MGLGNIRLDCEGRSMLRVILLREASTSVSHQSTYRGTSLIRNSAPLGPCSRTMPRPLWWS